MIDSLLKLSEYTEKHGISLIISTMVVYGLWRGLHIVITRYNKKVINDDLEFKKNPVNHQVFSAISYFVTSGSRNPSVDNPCLRLLLGDYFRICWEVAGEKLKEFARRDSSLINKAEFISGLKDIMSESIVEYRKRQEEEGITPETIAIIEDLLSPVRSYNFLLLESALGNGITSNNASRLWLALDIAYAGLNNVPQNVEYIWSQRARLGEIHYKGLVFKLDFGDSETH